jgi:hypothetical protein
MIPAGNQSTGLRSRGAIGAIALLIALTAGCGFSDELTRRGFIQEGDQICGETILQTAFALEEQGGLAAGAGEYLGGLGRAYGDASRRFNELNVDEEDEPMRDRIVSGFETASDDLGRASDQAATGADIEMEAARIFTETGTLLDEIDAYGFDVCGGRISQRPQ